MKRLQPDPDPRKRLTVWDTELQKFGCTVTHRGVITYIVQYRPGGRGTPTRRVTIGRHGQAWQPDTARAEARNIIAVRDTGGDPFELRKRKRLEEIELKALEQKEAANAERFEFARFRVEFVDQYAKARQPGSWGQTASSLARLDPDFKDIRVDQIDRPSIAAALTRLRKHNKTAPIAAHKALMKLYTWANDEQIISWHPMRGMDPPGKSAVRRRVLSSAELRTIWHAAEGLGYPWGPLYQLILATGLRLNDVARMARGEFYAEHQAVIIPASRMKRRPDDERGDFLVPLSPRALGLVKRLIDRETVYSRKLKPDARPLFTTDGMKPVAGFSFGKSLLDKAVAKAGSSGDWTAHDLRRTMATVMQPLGVPSNIIDRLQDHADKHRSRTALHYQHWDFVEEKRAGALVYGQYLDAAIDGAPEFAELQRQVDFKLLVRAPAA